MLPKIVSKPLPGPKAKKIIERDNAVISPSYTRDYPFVMAKGKGAIAIDPDGNEFLDFAAGIAVCSTGHSHPDVVKAICEQAKKFLHMSGTDFYYEQQVSIAEKICTKVPIKGPKKVFWSNSGTEAVEGAMKLARYVTTRPTYIAFLGAFHGRTFGSLSLTGSKYIQRKHYHPLLPHVYHIPYAYCFRCPYRMKYPECNDFCLTFLEDQLFQKLVYPERVAAIFMEPIQGEGGYVVPPKTWMQRLRKICDKYGILLVADEVQCGMGRTGKFFAMEHFDVEPDIICVAKGIASGMPLGGFISKASLMNWEYGSHASTFGGNPVCCAAALATFKLLEEKLVENSAKMGDYMMKRLLELQKTCECIGDVRGKGLMIGVEMVTDRDTNKPNPELRNGIITEFFNSGILALGCGANSLRFCPPLIVNKKQIDFVVDTLQKILKKKGC